jgi:hypothetical protein
MLEGKRELIGLSNNVCEAVGCNSKAKIKLTLRVGLKGRIPVFVCENCVSKFSANGSNECEVYSSGSI